MAVIFNDETILKKKKNSEKLHYIHFGSADQRNFLMKNKMKVIYFNNYRYSLSIVVHCK